MIYIDFETRSRCDLPVAGTFNYVTDPSTDIICLALINPETEFKQIWYPTEGPLPDMMRYNLVHADLIGAHSAEFDMGIYECVGVNDYNFPIIPFKKWYCTMAQCRVNALPAALDDAAWALGLKQRKDHRGQNLIKQLSIPQADGSFNHDPALIKEMGEYCMQDVIVTRAIAEATRPMTQNEHKDWLKTVEINERGVKVDLELATLSLQYADAEQAEIAVKMSNLTNGVVERHTQNIRIKNWIIAELGELHPIVEQMTVYKKGVKKMSLDKNIRRNILLMSEGDLLEIPDHITEVIQLLDDGNKSSVAKFKRMLTIATPDDHRIRGAFVFAGAGQTLRYTSRGLQLHNMRRDCWSEQETKDIKALMRQKSLYAMTKNSNITMMDTLSKLLRPAVIPEEGKVFVVGDWSSIESRFLHWATDTEEGDAKLDFFEAGGDAYTDTSDKLGLGDRQKGKVAELALGYQGAVKAFRAMARNYGVAVDENEAQNIVNQWRRINFHVVNFWRNLESAAKQAITHPNTKFHAGMVSYIFIPDFIEGTLLCNIGGGNFIQYPKAKIDLVMTPYGKEVYSVTCLKASYKPKADAKEWPRAALYGGLFCENVCQAGSAALLRNAVGQLDDVVAHVHDEIVMEVSKEYANTASEKLKSVMLNTPDWVQGLPLAMEPKIMYRYGK